MVDVGQVLSSDQPPASPIQQLKGKIGSSQAGSTYSIQCQSSHSIEKNNGSANESTSILNQDPSNTSFDEENTEALIHSQIEEYTENYSELTDRPVKEALEDLTSFRTSSFDQQAIIVRRLFTNAAFIGAPTSNMTLPKPILEYVPDNKFKQLLQSIIRYAIKLSVKFIYF
ncbi:unnamed protein product [Rotaria sp. Silwood2]|nr:unnamed protein product [Rotaria sp. Silwood2]CAF4265905.1 unnamed protein product [Rotaria sp. Silwood2]